VTSLHSTDGPVTFTPVTTASPFLRPAADEFAPYYGTYVQQVPDGDILRTLHDQAEQYRTRLAGVDEAQRLYRYAPGKWTRAESLQHVTDTERVFAYRALRIARADATPLPGFEQDDWILSSEADTRSLASLVQEFLTVRASTLALFAGLPASAWDRRGTASGQPVSVRGLAFIVAGHAAHHDRLFHERYLT
jgi:hypothetical protein